MQTRLVFFSKQQRCEQLLRSNFSEQQLKSLLSRVKEKLNVRNELDYFIFQDNGQTFNFNYMESLHRWLTNCRLPTVYCYVAATQEELESLRTYCARISCYYEGKHNGDTNYRTVDMKERQLQQSKTTVPPSRYQDTIQNSLSQTSNNIPVEHRHFPSTPFPAAQNQSKQNENPLAYTREIGQPVRILQDGEVISAANGKIKIRSVNKDRPRSPTKSQIKQAPIVPIKQEGWQSDVPQFARNNAGGNRNNLKQAIVVPYEQPQKYIPVLQKDIQLEQAKKLGKIVISRNTTVPTNTTPTNITFLKPTDNRVVEAPQPPVTKDSYQRPNHRPLYYDTYNRKG